MRYWMVIAILVLVSCKKAHERRCVKSAGESTTIEIALDSFDKLELGPNLNYILVQDTVEKMVITGGRNLVNFVESNIVDGRLCITNENKCSFLRSYKHEIDVELHLKDIFDVKYLGSSTLTCQDQLDIPYLTWLSEEGAGSCDLNVKSKVFNMILNGWGECTLNGEAEYLRIILQGYGDGNAYDINVTDSLNVISNSSGIARVRANNIPIRVETKLTGDVLYKGTPSAIEFNQYGTGDLIDQN